MTTHDATRTAEPSPTVSWDRIAQARTRVSARLAELPTGFFDVRDVELPNPTRTVVEHLVVGPRNVWLITTHVVGADVTHGRGRTADTLFAGRTPLRPELDSAEWEAETVETLLGVPVEPVLVLEAPSLPAPSFEVHGIHICTPDHLVEHLTASTGDFVDVAAVVGAIERQFGVTPTGGRLPTLAPVRVAPQLRPLLDARPRRTLGARLHKLRRRPTFRVAAVAALLGLLALAYPTIRPLWTTVAEEGSDRIAAAVDEVRDATAETETTASPPVSATSSQSIEPIDATVEFACTDGSWSGEWIWPGPLPADAIGYGIRTRIAGEAMVIHTATPWPSPAATAPTPLRLRPGVQAAVLTDVRAADGSIERTATSTVTAPTDPC